MKSKVVHIVLNTFVQDSRVMRECKSLAENGYDVTVIAYWMKGLKEEEHQNGYTVNRLQLISKTWVNNSIVQLFKYIEFLFKAILTIKIIKPQICHGHDPNGLLAAYLTKVFWDCKLIYDSHELWSDSIHSKGKKKFLYKIGREFEKLLIKKADAVITVNQSIADIMLHENKIPSINIVRNMPSKSKNSSILSKFELGFPKCKFNLIYTGNVEKGRGVNAVIEAFKSVRPDIGFIIMGRDSAYRNKMKEKVNTLKLAQRIKFIKAVLPYEVVNVCKLAEAGIAPIKNMCKSYYLSLPNKIFEYIQAGMPVLSSDFPEMKRIIDEYNIGLTFDVEDTTNISKLINALFDNNKIYKIFCDNSKKAAESLNWNVEQSKLIDLYQQLT